MENPIKMDDLGGKPTIFGNIHINWWSPDFWLPSTVCQPHRSRRWSFFCPAQRFVGISYEAWHLFCDGENIPINWHSNGKSTSKNVKFSINSVRSQEAILLWKGSRSLAVIPGHVEVNNEWVSAIVKDKFSDRNFLDASGEPNLINYDLVWQDWGMASFVPVRRGRGILRWV